MKILTTNKGVNIELHGREQLWSLRAKVMTPIGVIESIRFDEMFQDWNRWQVRMPGTNAPRLLLAGSYWTEEGWDFLYAKNPIGFLKPRLENVLVICTSQNKYRRVIVSAAKEEAERVLSWWKDVKRKQSV